MKTENNSISIKHNKNKIEELALDKGNVLNRSSLIYILHCLKKEEIVENSLTLNGLKRILVFNVKMFKKVSILYKDKLIIRYIPTFIKISPYEIALSLAPKKGHLSHLSAMYVNGITNIEPNTIYVNYEQSPKKIDKKNSILKQKNVDLAFTKPTRKTSQIASFQYKNKFYTIVLLNGKNTNYTGVTNIKPMGFSKFVRTSNVERCFIESMVRPNYSGGVSEILNSFSNTTISVNKVLAYLNNMNYIYPYIQIAHFYIKHTQNNNQKADILKKEINKRDNNINMYIEHQIIDPILDKDSLVYYPKKLLN